MSRSKRVRTLKTRREKEREEEEGRRGWKGRMHETSAEFRPSFSLSFSDLSPALRPLNLPEKRAFKAERTREAARWNQLGDSRSHFPIDNSPLVLSFH